MHEGQPHVRNQDGGRSIFDEPSLPKGPFLPGAVKEDMLRKPEAYKGINDKESILFKESKASGGEAGLMDLAYIPAGAPGMLSQLGLQVGFAAGLGEEIGPWGRTALVAAPFVPMAARIAKSAPKLIGEANMAIGQKISQRHWNKTLRDANKPHEASGTTHLIPGAAEINPVVNPAQHWSAQYKHRGVIPGHGKNTLGIVYRGTDIPGQINRAGKSATRHLRDWYNWKVRGSQSPQSRGMEGLVHEGSHGLQNYYEFAKPITGVKKGEFTIGSKRVLRPKVVNKPSQSLGMLPRVPPEKMGRMGEIGFGTKPITRAEDLRYALRSKWSEFGSGLGKGVPLEEYLGSGSRSLTTYGKYLAKPHEIEARIATTLHLGKKTGGFSQLKELGYSKKEIADMKKEYGGIESRLKHLDKEMNKIGAFSKKSPGEIGYVTKRRPPGSKQKEFDETLDKLNKSLKKRKL